MSGRLLSGAALIQWSEELVRERVLPLVQDGQGDEARLAELLAECYVMGALAAIREETDRLRRSPPRPVDGNRPT